MNPTEWLLMGDPSIVFQTHRDLLSLKKEKIHRLQQEIGKKGWAAEMLKQQRPDGHWGQRYYQPKWISTHYTLLDLRYLCLPRGIPSVEKILEKVLTEEIGSDGGVNPANSTCKSDLCINGMALNFCSWFGVPEKLLHHVIDFTLSQQMPDGGFNCQKNRSGARHSSLHTTISALEGLWEYRRQGYSYRLEECEKARRESEEFLLLHRLFKSDHSGEIIHKRFLEMHFPCRWYYDFLRALDYFQDSKHPGDERLQDALELLESKETKEGLWKLNAHHTGQVHIKMEQAGKASRWNTLRALRVLKHFQK